MNIVIIPAFFQEKRRPTLGSFFWDQAKALKRAEHQVSILYCDAYSVKLLKDWVHYPETKVEEKEGIVIYREKCLCPMKHGMKGHKYSFAKCVEKLYEKYFSNQKVDMIHAHCSVWAGLAAMRISQKYDIPYVVTEHATLFQLHKASIGKKDNRLIRDIFQNASSAICVSGAFKEVLSEYRKDMKVIGNVVDCSQFAIREGFRNEKLTFLSVCYMQTEQQLQKKGIDILIQAWEILIKKYPDVRLVLGGGGNALPIVKQWCNQAQVEDSVVFLGDLSRQQVVEQMQLCDCFVLPSRYETFGVVYIEAMACGKPVIGVKNGGPDDFVNEHNGILLQTLEPEALAFAMEQMITEREKYNPYRIRQEVVQQFSYEAIAGQLEKEYQNCLIG